MGACRPEVSRPCDDSDNDEQDRDDENYRTSKRPLEAEARETTGTSKWLVRAPERTPRLCESWGDRRNTQSFSTSGKDQVLAFPWRPDHHFDHHTDDIQ